MDHQAVVTLHLEVNELGQSWLSGGKLWPDEASHLVELVGRLATLYERHIALEDTEVFPAAAALLSSSDRQAISLEMAARRGLDAK